jgi:hypothetical protein
LIDLIGKHQASKSNTVSFFIKQIKHEDSDICKYLQIFGALLAAFWVGCCVVRLPNFSVLVLQSDYLNSLLGNDASAPHQHQHQPPDRDKQSIPEANNHAA